MDEGRAWVDSQSSVVMLRGTPTGIEFVFADDGFEAAWAEIDARLRERPEFYRGSAATIVIHATTALPDTLLGELLRRAAELDIAMRGIAGSVAVAEAAARRHELPYLGEPPRRPVASLERKRARPSAVGLTRAARSLDADFAGARADIARRRARGEASVAKPVVSALPVGPAREAAPAVAVAGARYHRGTIRGGQSLHQLGDLIVIGDVNPGAELVATGDIVVFGALRGTAHAGAQGDIRARVYALDLAPTQLRIATCIAAGSDVERARIPEVAFIDGDHIAIAAHGDAR